MSLKIHSRPFVLELVGVASSWGPGSVSFQEAWRMILAGVCGYLGAHVQAGRVSLEISPCAKSQAGLGKGEEWGAQGSMLAWCAGGLGLGN